MATRSTWMWALIGSLWLSACAHNREHPRPTATQAEGRGYHYIDESGLRVTTIAARGSQRVADGWQVDAQAVADHVMNEPPPVIVPVPPGPGQPTGHLHEGVDVISTASVLANEGPVRTEEWRFEGTAGATRTFEHGDVPVTLQSWFRGSTEPDYRSLSGRVIASAELFERNTTVTANAGGGNDVILPLAAPPGQEDQWPASHARWSAGASVVQLVTPAVTASGGVGFTHQWGQLGSPYRRALVRTTLFPEAVPDVRLRFTAFGGVSWFIGGRTALHFRQGAYLDTWGVRSLLPELAVVKEVGATGLLSLRYRLYRQSAASFYRPVYRNIEPLLSGDPRNGELTEHTGGVELRWTPIGRLGWAEALTLVAGYELSLLSYESLGSSLRAQVFSVALVWGR